MNYLTKLNKYKIYVVWIKILNFSVLINTHEWVFSFERKKKLCVENWKCSDLKMWFFFEKQKIRDMNFKSGIFFGYLCMMFVFGFDLQDELEYETFRLNLKNYYFLARLEFWISSDAFFRHVWFWSKILRFFDLWFHVWHKCLVWKINLMQEFQILNRSNCNFGNFAQNYCITAFYFKTFA